MQDYRKGAEGSGLAYHMLVAYAKRNLDILNEVWSNGTAIIERKRWNGNEWEEVN